MGRAAVTLLKGIYTGIGKLRYVLHSPIHRCLRFIDIQSEAQKCHLPYVT